MCVRARACVGEGVCAWVDVGARAWACACARAALLIKPTTRRRHIVLSSAASLAPPHFSTLSHKTARFLGGEKSH